MDPNCFALSVLCAFYATLSSLELRSIALVNTPFLINLISLSNSWSRNEFSVSRYRVHQLQQS